MLGETPIEYMNFIKKQSEENSWEIIDIMKHPIYSSSDPSDFVSLIRYSQMVITDSFHGSVFSLLYHKKLYLLERLGVEDMSSRLSTLWNLFNVKIEKIDGISLVNVNWDSFEKKLVKLREESISYLKQNL